MSVLDNVMDEMNKTYSKKRPARNEEEDRKKRGRPTEAGPSTSRPEVKSEELKYQPPPQTARDWGKSPFPRRQEQQPPPPPQSGGQRFGDVNPFEARRAASQGGQQYPQSSSFGDVNPFEARRAASQQGPPQGGQQYPQSSSYGSSGSQGSSSYRQQSYDRRDSRGGDDRRDRPYQERKPEGFRGDQGERKVFEQDSGHRGGYGGRGGYGQGRGGYQSDRGYQGGYQRGNQGRDAVGEIEVQMNALAIKTQCEKVRRYHVTMVKTLKSGAEKDITKTPKNDQAAILKENCVFAIMHHLMEQSPEIFGPSRYNFAYDGGPTLYTCNFNMPREHEWVFTKESFKSFPKPAIDGLGAFVKVVIAIKETGNIKIRDCDPTDPNREANKFFDVVLSAYAKEGNFLNYGQKCYQKGGRDEKDIHNGKVIKKGLEKSTKVIGTENGEAKIHLQVSSRASAFQKSINMMEFICDILDMRDPHKAVRYLNQDKRAMEKINAELRNMFVKTTHLPGKARYFSIKGLNKMSANEYKFVNNKNGDKVSVKEYIAATYNIELKYPDAPLAAEVYTDKTSLHPLELLEVAIGQRVGTGRLGNLAEEVHKQARSMPHEQKANVERELEKIRLLHSDNPYLRAFGISIESDFVRTMARVMAAPERIGARNTSGRNLIFASGADISNRLAVVVIVDRCISTRQAEEFWRKMQDNGSKKGMRLPRSAEILDQSGIISEIEKMFTDWQLNKEKSPALAVFITKDKRDELHHVFKYYEDRCGIQTQHLCVDTINKVCATQGGIVTIENVLRKMNPKLGGVNDTLQPNRQEFAQNKDLLNEKMFIGLELSHPAAQTLFDREAGSEVSTPTVVGMAYSLDRIEKLSGTFWFQNPRLTTIQNLERYIFNALKTHMDTSKKMPRQLWIYRHGSSEGERKEMDEEIACIRDAVRRMNAQIQLVFVLCISHSGTTLLPTNLPPAHQRVKARDVNVQSGTVLDTGIEKTGVPEFFIKSQESNIGTSHMLRVLILANDPNVPLLDLEKITHWLAFAHQVCSMPTSKPAVLYAANELAKRGANHFKTDQMIWAEHQGGGRYVEAHSRFDIRADETPEAYYSRKSDEAQSSFRHHFWA